MANTYISNGEAHITIDSADWKNYCDFLKTKLESLKAERKKIDARIAEIHAILHPPVIEDVEDEEEVIVDMTREARKEPNVVKASIKTDVQPEEKYLLVKDIANKYNATTESVKSACERGRVPCHRVGEEWRFTPSDVEQLSSIVSRRKVFEPRPKVNIIKKAEAPKVESPYTVCNPTPPKGTITTKETIERLGITHKECGVLRKNNLLAPKTLNDVPIDRGIALFYIESEVNALCDMMKSDGGKEAFFAKLKKKEEKTA